MQRTVDRWRQKMFTPVCLACGSFFCTDALFCRCCLDQKILKRVAKIKLTHLPHDEHHYLFNWQKTDPNYVSQLVYRLKGNQSPAAWKYFAKIFFEENKNRINFTEFDVLIPVPSARRGRDHAIIFSNELARLCGLAAVSALEKRSASQQKNLSSKQRMKHSSVSVKKTAFEQITRCLFVDDVLTTGQTYQNCKSSLPKLTKCAVISLFYRPRES